MAGIRYFGFTGLSDLRLTNYETGAGIRWYVWQGIALTPSVGVSFSDEHKPTSYEENWSLGLSLALERHFGKGRLVPYGALGARYEYEREEIKSKVDADEPPGSYLGATDKHRSGGPWLGFGIEWAVVKRVSVSGEYRLAFDFECMRGEERRQGAEPRRSHTDRDRVLLFTPSIYVAFVL